MDQGLPGFNDKAESMPEAFDRQAVAAKLRKLAAEKILIGTSSWRYPGWLGQIYSRDRYMTRGKFSKAKFESTCLAEYAETFSTVGGDFSFYQFPAPEFWTKLFDSAPAQLTFGLKAPEDVTAKQFSTHVRYGPRAGTQNPLFLDAAAFEDQFLGPLMPYRERVPVIMFEFGTFAKQAYSEPQKFFDDLNSFLSSLPAGWRYGVEIRNEGYLVPEYFQVLRENNAAHVLNAWTRMPPIYRQMEIPDIFTADFTVVRALLRVGRPYETAVKIFEPYDRVQDPNPPTRQGIWDLMELSRKRGQPTYIFVNNRLEGNAPGTIEGILDHAQTD